VAYGFVVVVVVVVLVARRRDDLADLVEGAQPAWLLLALALGFLQLVLNAAFWSAALRGLGEPRSGTEVLDAGARSLLARYVPGSIWYQVSRAALLRRDGASTRAVSTVAVLDTALGVVVGAVIGTGLLASAGRLPGGDAWLVLWVVLLAVGCSPPVVNAGLRLLSRWRGGEAARLAWPQFLVLLGWMALFWVNAAAMFTVYLHAFPGVSLPSTLEVAGSFMVSWVVGFFAVFAPQGAGVFEVTVANLLVDGPIGAVALVVAGYRALLLVRDVVAVGAANLLRTRRRQKQFVA
jgi:hypothetical protein